MKAFRDLKKGDFVYMWYPRFADKARCIHQTEVLDVIVDKQGVYNIYFGYHSREGEVVTDKINIHPDNINSNYTHVGSDVYLFTEEGAVQQFDFKTK